MLVTTRKLLSQTGFVERKAIFDAGGEEMMPGVRFALETFKTMPLSITELFACNTQMSMWKGEMADWGSSSVSMTSTGRPLDSLIGPTSASAGSLHDVPGYCGYMSVANILDYPPATLPLKGFKICAQKDPKDLLYQPRRNPYDSIIHKMCNNRNPLYPQSPADF
jgi:amidase